MGLIADISPVDPKDIARVFSCVTPDLSVVIVVDDVEETEDGFRVRTHDLHGPMPEIRIPQLRTQHTTIDRAQREATSLYAVARIRNELRELMPDCQFLPPTLTRQGVTVGILPRDMRKVLLGDGSSVLQAYRDLQTKCHDRPKSTP